ncbi:LysM peptidoglycan-binding domain-containing protein [Tumebacillus sp. ITR2]|uniref:LysM peptidoglycan-binding domain-containing protein n=1 Tax=Tumebacillus amylolyticus TaxID=2801339 RepID=A0ABS1JCY4_9BACL|nr:LysM peptidoglycan-binding domain-containing protein [Tumebacillus amylolyticus]MBL0387493.1 LysM peptidoglycan-binding domain-containing protein [Tumebacillus amylolyticus]
MKVYSVQKGDSMWKISKMWSIPLDQLIAANPQIANPDQIDVGMQINIPGTGMSPGEPEVTPTPDATDEGGAVPAPTAELPEPAPAPTPAPAEPQAYPSVPKWEGLWKYVVKHGDDVLKIAKQVGVTIEMLKAANPQLAHTLHLDKIYPGQVLNIPSSGMKPKTSNPGMTKEQMTAPVAPVSPFTTQEQLTTPKEMVTMEKPINITPPPMPVEMPMPAPAPMTPHIDLNLQYAPHKDSHNNTNINWQLQNLKPQVQAPVVMPQEHHYMHHHPMVMMYIPVSTKKKHKKKCHKKVKKCGCHQQHHHHPHAEHMHHQMLMASMINQQHIGMMPKTFYRDED